MIRVLIVDDHPLVRTGFAALAASDPDITVVGEAPDGAAGIQLTLDTAPDVVLMDLSMPGMDGVQATRTIHHALPGVAIVILTSFPDDDRVRSSLEAGAVGYLLKDSEPNTILRGIKDAAAGNIPLDPRVTRAVLPTHARGEDNSPPVPLSGRELEVLRLVAQGLANKQIARSLNIREATVKAHLGSIFRAINVTDRTSAAMWARDHRIA